MAGSFSSALPHRSSAVLLTMSSVRPGWLPHSRPPRRHDGENHPRVPHSLLTGECEFLKLLVRFRLL